MAPSPSADLTARFHKVWSTYILYHPQRTVMERKHHSSSMSLSEFTSGAIFGAALFSAGVFTPVTVKSQMTFQSNKMLTVFLGASATSA